MRVHYPDPTRLEIREGSNPEKPWELYSTDPEWVALSIKRSGVVLRFPTRDAALEWKNLQRKLLPVVQNRSCGNCHACCTALGIEELRKPPGEPCNYLGSLSEPCSLYEKRPTSCREYFCGWRLGMGDISDRPDLSGLVISPYDTIPDMAPKVGKVILIGHEVWPGARMNYPGGQLLKRVADMQFLVLVVYGEQLNHTMCVGAENVIHAFEKWRMANKKIAPFGILKGYEERG